MLDLMFSSNLHEKLNIIRSRINPKVVLLIGVIIIIGSLFSSSIYIFSNKWILTRIIVNGTDIELYDNISNLNFDILYGAYGDGGCNGYRGYLQVFFPYPWPRMLKLNAERIIGVQGEISISSIGSTLMACLPAISNQEYKFFSSLNKVELFHITPNRLLLFSRDNQIILEFRSSSIPFI